MSSILLVDDDPMLLSCLEELLVQARYTVIARQSAADALVEVEKGTPVDLVITDYKMSGMDGIEFLFKLRHLHPDVPAFMLTGHGTLEGFLKANCLGAVDYLHKPVRARDLVRIVENALADRKRSIIAA